MGIDKKSLKSALQIVAKKQISNYKQVGKKTMKEIRESITNEWFGEFSSFSMNKAIVYSATSKLINEGSVIARVKITSWVDVNRYNPDQYAQKWKAEYGGEVDAREYVLGLQLEDGIIGLPEKSKYRQDSNWVNPNFHMRGISLRNAIENNARWDNFSNTIQNLL